ncbi:MAG: hypothetical protein U1C74_04170, partial [Phenylobacterium sp.]|nr:hypothetical protein [Phenylobacterium sp.]
MTRWVAAVLAAGLIGLVGAPVQADEAPLLTVRIAPSPMDESVNTGRVDISIQLPQADFPAGKPLFVIPPGADLAVHDAEGPVPRATAEGRDYVATRRVHGELVIRYHLDVRNTPDNGGTTPIRPRLDGRGFSAIGMTLLAEPKTDRPHRIRIEWDLSAMGPGASAVSSFGDGTVMAPAGPVARLGRTVFMAGVLERDPPPPGNGRFAAVWSGDAGFDVRPPMRWTEALHSWMVDFFQTPNDPAYRVFLRANGGRNPGGGVAFPNSFFATWGPGVTG